MTKYEALSQLARPLRAWRNTHNTNMQSRSMLRAWRKMVDGDCSPGLARTNTQQQAVRNAKATFQTWSKSVPARTRQWARLFSKLDCEHSRVGRHAPFASPCFERAACAARGRPTRPGVAQMFGANNPAELRTIFKDFMKDLSKEEREEMRFVLQAEAISRGLGKYSIQARGKYF